MPKMQLSIRLKNAPPLTYTAQITTAGDLPRFFGNAAKAYREALRVFPAIKDHTIEKITVALE